MEDHPPHGDLRLEHLEQMPGDGLSLAVFIRREQELVGALQELLERRDVRLAVRRHQIDGREVVGDIDGVGVDVLVALAQLLLQLARDGQVTDVTDGGFHDKALPQILLDGGGFGRGLDDDE